MQHLIIFHISQTCGVCVICVCVFHFCQYKNIFLYFCIFAVLFFCRRHIKLIRRAPFVFASLYSIYFAIPFAFLSLSLYLTLFLLLHCQMLRAKVGNGFFLAQLLCSLAALALPLIAGAHVAPSTPHCPLCSYTSNTCAAAAAVDISRSWEFMFSPQRQVNELQQISPACGLLGGIYLFIYRVRRNKDTIWRLASTARGRGEGRGGGLLAVSPVRCRLCSVTFSFYYVVKIFNSM